MDVWPLDEPGVDQPDHGGRQVVEQDRTLRPGGETYRAA
jgi:hypothetical protein